MVSTYKTSLQKSKIRAKAEKLSEKLPISVEDIEFSIRGLAWAVEETMRMAERYFHTRIHNLLLYDVELITKSKLVPTEMGFKLELEVEIPDETIMYFAFNLGKRAKLLKSKYASIRVAKYLRKKKRRTRKNGD